MDYIKGKKRRQETFLPDCIEDMIDDENPVRVIGIRRWIRYKKHGNN